MNILNRYVLKKFTRPFLAAFGALCIVIFVSQLFDRLDRFLADGVSITSVIGYLLTSLPLQAIQVLPVACLLGTLFVVGDLARNREYIAGLAGGIAPEKFLGGILLAGFSISIAGLIINETIVPPTSRYATTVFREKIRRIGDWRNHVVNDLAVAGTDGRMWSAKLFNEDHGTMERVVVDTYRNGLMGPQIDAASAHWTPEGWVFTNGVARTFQNDQMTIATITPFKEQLFPFHERTSDFIIQETLPEQMNFKSLRAHIERLKSLGVATRRLEVELMMKLSFPFSCFVVTCLGIPLALRGRGSRAKGIAAAGALTLAYMGSMQFGKAMAQRLIPPLLGAWVGNLLFLALAIVMWRRMRRAH